MRLTGRAWTFGDGISTDHIAPGRLFHLRSNLPELAKHVLEDARPEFASQVKAGDFVVGGRNFGQGSSREHAPTVIKLCGVGAVLAKGFARIFFRNCVNGGYALPCESTERLCDGAVSTGDELEVDVEHHRVTNRTTGKSYELKPLGDVKPIIDAGGVFAYARQSGMLAE